LFVQPALPATEFERFAEEVPHALYLDL
jgi:hypothetical protein